MRGLIEALNGRFAAVSTGRNVLLVLLAAFLVQLLFGAWLVLFLLCALVTLMLAGIAASSALAVNRRG